MKNMNGQWGLKQLFLFILTKFYLTGKRVKEYIRIKGNVSTGILTLIYLLIKSTYKFIMLCFEWQLYMHVSVFVSTQKQNTLDTFNIIIDLATELNSHSKGRLHIVSADKLSFLYKIISVLT